MSKPNDEKRPQGQSPEDWNPADVVAYVGKGVTFKGEIKYDGTVKVDGTMEGEIETSGTLLVGADAVIRAQVKAGSVICRGAIKGDIIAETKVNLLASASVTGSVQTPLLSMEEGVEFNGTLQMANPRGADNEQDRPVPAMTSLPGGKRAIG
jgi:cytoskeletal protein CcmA (bactofilin family)